MNFNRPFSAFAIGVLTLALPQCAGGSSAPTTPSPTPSPSPSPSPTPSPSPAPTGGSLSISPQSIQGQGQPQGTVTLGSAAPSSGVVVQLQSSNTNVAKVPASVTVTGGSRTATFAIDTSTVQSPTTVTITASFSGTSMSANLTVTAGTVGAGFVVRSASRGTGACVVEPDAVDFDCVLDGSQSSGPVAAWIWTYTMGTSTLGHTSSTANSHPQIVTKCAFLSTATGGDARRLPILPAASTRPPWIAIVHDKKSMISGIGDRSPCRHTCCAVARIPFRVALRTRSVRAHRRFGQRDR